MSELIKIGVSGFAECVASDPASRLKKLRPFKFKNKGEGAGRSAYYQRALAAIREYHRSGRNPAVFARARHELEAALEAAVAPQDRTKCTKNTDAIEAYERIYGRRNFRILRNHRLAYRIGGLTITAQPDLWVEENGTQVLIKI